MTFTQQLVKEMEVLREVLRSDETLSHVHLRIEIEGRLEGDLKLTFGVGTYGVEVSSGSNFDSAIAEFLRRRGWNERHNALCLPKVQVAEEAPSAPSE